MFSSVSVLNFSNGMEGTVSYLRLQYDKHICVQNELERKKNEIIQLKDEARQASQTIAAKEQHIKDLENHFDTRRFVHVLRIISFDLKQSIVHGRLIVPDFGKFKVP